MKKLVSVLLVALLAVAFTPRFDASADQDAVTLKVLAPWFSTYDPADTRVQQEFVSVLSREMGMDVTLDYTYYGWATEYREKLNVAINAADLPWDIIGLNGVSGGDGTYQGGASLYNQLGQTGFFVNLAEQDMPNLKARMEECGELVDYMYDENGGLYYSPMFTENQNGTFNANRGIVIDKTIFDENGIAYPTSSQELLDAARKLKEIYPETWPILSTGTGATAIISSFDEQVFRSHSYKLGFDGERYTVDGVQEDYREMLRYVRTLYAEGLIAPDYAAWDSDMITSAQKSGGHAIYLNFYLANQNAGLPDGHEFLMLSYALAENDGGWWGLRGAMTEISANTWGCAAVNALSDKAELACKALDISLGEECHNLLAMGFEGESYEIDEDGNKVFIGDYLTATGSDPAENVRMKLGLAINGTCMSGFFPVFAVTNTEGVGENTYLGFVMPDGSVEYANPYVFGQEHWTYDNMEPENSVDVSLPSLTSDERDYVAEVTDPLYTYMSESFARFVTGELDISDDAAWQSYLDECYQYDIDGICEIYNKYIEGKQMYNK